MFLITYVPSKREGSIVFFLKSVYFKKGRMAPEELKKIYQNFNESEGKDTSIDRKIAFSSKDELVSFSEYLSQACNLSEGHLMNLKEAYPLVHDSDFLLERDRNKVLSIGEKIQARRPAGFLDRLLSF